MNLNMGQRIEKEGRGGEEKGWTRNNDRIVIWIDCGTVMALWNREDDGSKGINRNVWWHYGIWDK